MRFFLILFSFLYANIVQFENLKPFYYKNQIINLQVKILTNSEENVSCLTNRGKVTNITVSPYVYEANITFKANNSPITLYVTSNTSIEEINLSKKIHLKDIEKIPHFCGVFANDLNVSNVISSEYNTTHNIVSFNINGKLANLEDFSLNNNEKKVLHNKEVSYYTIIPKNKKEILFYYYNLLQNRFIPIKIPVILKEEKVVTQSDITPKENYFSPLNVLLLGFSMFLFLSAFVFRSFILGLLAALILGFTLKDFIPKGDMYLPPNTKVYLLPTFNSTVIEVTNSQRKVKILKKLNGYTKIIIDNKIGWVKNEN